MIETLSVSILTYNEILQMYLSHICYSEASQVVLVVKNPPAARGLRGVVSLLGLGRSPGEGDGRDTEAWGLQSRV